MIKIDVQGMDAIQRKLAAMPGKIRQTAKRALINTALSVRDDLQDEMRKVFDRPTRWTIGAIRVKATDDMTVIVGVVDPDGYYRRANYFLGTQIGGGPRGAKAFEKALQAYGYMPAGWRAVPGEGATLDGNGNMGPGQIRQILSYLGTAERWAGSTQNMTAAKRDKLKQGTKTKMGFEYVVIRPDSKRGKLLPGIYKRTFTAFGSAIKPIIIFVKGTSYRKRYDMERVARATINRDWQRKFSAAIDKALAS